MAVSAQRNRSWLLRVRISHLLERVQPPEALVTVGLAVLAGFGVGGAYLVFHYLIALVQEIGFVRAAAWLSPLGQFYVVLIPALGGLLVGPLVVFLAPEAKGHGVPEVMEAVALRGGRIRPVVAVVKSVASAVTIGSGGSAGREGPIVQIGSALGSALGQWLRLSDRRIRTLVACGAAGGIAATFKAPIAGVIFAVEVILGEVEVESIGNVVIAAVTASVVGRLAFGASPVFAVPRYNLVSPWELGFYAVLGVLAAAVGVAFIRVLYALEDMFGRWRVPAYLKPAAGGLLVGLVGLAYPQVFGAGYETIGKSLLGTMDVGLALVLLGAKLVATSLTLGSGASGGIFAPSLYMGAMLGAAFGSTVHALWPAVTAGSGAYAIVGMAAVFSGAARAPLTALMILFEMTDDYRIILPLMLACVVSTLVAGRLHRESIYTEKLVRRGIHLQRGRDIDVMQGITVGEAMEEDPEWVPLEMPLRDLADKFATSHYNGFPVLDAEGNLYGVVTLQDLERVTSEGKRQPGATVRDIATTSLVVAYPDEPLWTALKRMGVRDIGQLPVVSREDPKRLVGWLRRSDIVRAYNAAIARRVELQHRMDRLRLGRVASAEFVELVVNHGGPVAGRPIRDLDLPRECVLVSVQRGRRLVLPHGDTVLQPGDRVVALVHRDCKEQLRQAFGLSPGGQGDGRVGS